MNKEEGEDRWTVEQHHIACAMINFDRVQLKLNHRQLGDPSLLCA
jgi:hypothetical protein